MINKINSFVNEKKESVFIIKDNDSVKLTKICDIYADYFLDNNIGFTYNNYMLHLFKLERGVDMILELPYKNRSDYYEIIYEFNKVVSKNGIVMLAVYNDPINGSRSYIALDNLSDKEIKEITKINSGQLKEVYGKVYSDFLNDMKMRKCNIVTLCEESDFELLKIQLSAPFLFSEERDLQEKGYKLSSKEAKVFISYCHKDSEIVNKLENYLSNKDLQVWYDKNDIEYGDNILEKMSNGMQNSDIGILLLSSGYKNSLYGKHELNVFMNNQIVKSKDILPVKLDSVEPDEILFGLSNIKYLEYEHSKGEDALFQQIYDCILRKSKKFNL